MGKTFKRNSEKFSNGNKYKSRDTYNSFKKYAKDFNRKREKNS